MKPEVTFHLDDLLAAYSWYIDRGRLRVGDGVCTEIMVSRRYVEHGCPSVDAETGIRAEAKVIGKLLCDPYRFIYCGTITFDYLPAWARSPNS